jgi:hypothetical protein
MSKNIVIAVGAAIVGALAVLLYNLFVAAPISVLHPPRPCNQGTCPIDVTVYIDCSDPNNILAGPERAPIARGNRDPVIEWTIYKSGYTFAPNGIDFHGDPQFHDPQPQGDKKFRWFDTNSETTPTYHKYTINLLRDGVACPPLDPGIINGQ